MTTKYTPAFALALLGRATMRPFNAEDWMAFAGCDSKDPMIGEYGTLTLVVDGETLLIVDSDNEGDGDYGGVMFQLKGGY